jgi:plastocyanin
MQARRTIRISTALVREYLTFAALLVFLLPLATATAAQARLTAAEPTSSANVVNIDNFSFAPKELTIAAGTQITWTNKDDVPHTIVSVDHQFKSKTLDTDEKFSFIFQSAGTYEYFCSIHPKMTGKIIVK